MNKENIKNDTAQAPPAQENNETSPAPAGGCLPRPCSACGSELSEHAVIAKTLQVLDLKFEQSAHSLAQSLGVLRANRPTSQEDASRVSLE